jgi:hypothetical protein
MSKARTLAANATARKVVGSLGIIGATAAVAGMGTFGSFTASTSPTSTTVNSGTLSINLSQAGYAIPASTSNFVPGDSMTRAVNLNNNGGSPFGAVALATTTSAPSILTTDLTNGLQMTVKSCSVAWTQGGTASAPTYTCGGTTNTLGSGPVVSTMALPGLNSLAAGGTDYLTFSISLPTTADNTFQGKSAPLTLTFTGSQATGGAR